jgi:putative ABC transport system ATP-binding protein
MPCEASDDRARRYAIRGRLDGQPTLMNLIGCLDTPSKGSYLLNDKQVSQMNDDELARIRNEEIDSCSTFNCCLRDGAAQRRAAVDYGGPRRRGTNAQRRHSIESSCRIAKHRPNELSGGSASASQLRALVNNPRSFSPTSRRAI